MDPYHHHHENVEEIPWSRLGKIFIEFTEMIRANYNPEIIVGIAKGGVIPGVYISSALMLDFFPIKLSSRHNEKVIYKDPVWHVFPTEAVAAKRVLLVDDICVAGRTLSLAKEKITELGANEVRTATLAVHEGSIMPDFHYLKTDALIVWPWDRDVVNESGKWHINPEYLEEMNEIPGYKPGVSPANIF